MKIRMGFVSNSSSSSFCIYGTFFNYGELSTSKQAKELEKENGCEHEFDREKLPFCAQCGKPAFVEVEMDEDEDEDDLDVWYNRASSLGLECDSPDGHDGYYIGLSWADVGDDETGLQFKERVEKLVKECCGQEMDCSTHEAAYYC